MSFIQEAILFLSAWAHFHLILVGSIIHRVHLILIRPCFTVGVRSFPRDMQGHRVKQIALEFLPQQPQFFLRSPWVLGSHGLLHKEVSTAQPYSGHLLFHHLAVIPHLLVWAPGTHKGQEGLWSAQGTEASVQLHIYTNIYMYIYMCSWAEHVFSACRCSWH